MKVQKKVSVQGEWAKPKQDIDSGDIIRIKNSGEIIQGEYGDRHVFKVATKNGEKLLSLNQTSLNYLIDAFGDETESWVGKDIKVWLVKSNIQGKMKDVVYLTALDWIESDEGFCPPNEKDDIPVINEEDEGL